MHGYSWYIYPKNNRVFDVVFQAGIDPTSRSLEYKGKEVKNLIKVDVDFIKYWESSVKDGGIDWFKIDLYSRDKNGVIRKHKFPRSWHSIDEQKDLFSISKKYKIKKMK